MTRKSTIFALAAALLSAVLSTSTTQAAISYSSWFTSVGGGGVSYPFHTNGDNQVTLNWPMGTYGHTGGGGEFRVGSIFGGGDITYVDLKGTSRQFTTFCLEQSEHIYLGSRYNVSVDSAAYFGANNSPDYDNLNNVAMDILNRSTKVLYGAYFDGTLHDNDKVAAFSFNSNSSADALQAAIWAIEDNVSVPGLSVLAKLLYDYALAHANDAIGDHYASRVGVMNLWTPQAYPDDQRSSPTSGTAAQSQLMWLGDPSQTQLTTPEPASLAIWALGLAATAAYRHRRRAGLWPAQKALMDI